MEIERRLIDLEKQEKVLGHFDFILPEQTLDKDVPSTLLRRFRSERGNILLVCDIAHIKLVFATQLFLQPVQSVFATSCAHDSGVLPNKKRKRNGQQSWVGASANTIV